MPPEPLPFDRKDFLKDRKPSSVGIVPPRWREPPTTPSQHNIHGSSLFCRWGAGDGPSDFRRPFSGLHGKTVGGGWHNTTVESGSREKNCMTNSESMAFGSQKDKDPKGVNSFSWETTASPNGNSLPHNDFVNSLDQLQSADQHAKNSGGGSSATNSQRLEKETTSLDWKPLKWIRSGSLSSRGSGFSHSSGCKIIGVVDPFNGKLGAQLGNSTPLRSPSEDAAPCVTPMTHDEATSRKKQRLGWGEGLAKYEKKKVDPDPEDILDKEAGGRNGMVTSPSSLSDKSPGVNECASPTTPYSYACSSSPGLEEKESTKTVTVDNDTCNPSVASCHLSENDTSSNLELNFGSALDKLLQTDDSCSPGSKFVKSTAMDKLHVWKAELTRTLEITETEIDSLEHELKSLVSDGGSCPFLTEYQNKTCGPLAVEKTDSSPEEVNGVEDSDDKSSDTTSEFVESVSKCSEDLVNDDVLGFVTCCGDGSSSTVLDGEDVDNGREDDKLYDLIFATNKVIANEASDELSRILLPTTHLCRTNISKATDESLNKIKIGSRKRFLKFKERVITSKFRVLQHAWKEELQLLSIKKTGAKSHKKFESSSRMGYADHQKYCSAINSRLCSPGGSVSLVPTTETLDYVKKLLSDSRVRVQRNTLKMPCLILDRSERMMSRFISDNGLVENPVEVEKERSVVNAWTEEEQGIFLEKYCLFGKDFKKIASFLKYRTCGDCVEFYYKNHKSDCFQKTKKNSVFAKGMCCSTAATYLVTSGRRLNLEMLGAGNVDGEEKLDSGMVEMFCNEQETAAADVLAGICGSVSSEGTALGSCITGSVEHGDVQQQHDHGRRRRRCQMFGGGSSLKRRQHLTEKEDVDEESGSDSDESCGEEAEASWSDAEKLKFIKAFRSCGKNFANISICVKTKTIDQCRVFFSKARKCLGLDLDVSEGDKQQEEEGGSDPEEDALMVDSGSDISQDNKSCLECSKMDNLEGGENTCSGGEIEMNEKSCASDDDAKVGSSEICIQEVIRESESDGCDGCLDLRCNNRKLSCSDGNNGLLMSNLFPGNPTTSSGIPYKEANRMSSQEDVSSSSRKSYEEDKKKIMMYDCEGRDGFHLNLVPKHSLLDCAEAEESSQTLGGYPVNSNASLSYSEATQTQSKLKLKLKLDESLLMAQEARDVEKASRTGNGNVKLFGQIITNQPPQAQAQENEYYCGGKGKSFELKFDEEEDRRKAMDVDESNILSRKSDNDNGYWGDGTIPDSARLLAKYPAAFSKTPYSSFHPFPFINFNSSSLNKIIPSCSSSSSKNGGGRQEGVGDKLVDVNVNGISDAVAAIRMHYAYAANKTDVYNYNNNNNKVEDEAAAAWR